MTVPPPYNRLSEPSERESRRPLWDRCCFCIPIRVGCLIMGYLSLIYNFFHTLSFTFIVIAFGIGTHGFDHFDGQQIEDNIPDGYRILGIPTLGQLGLILILLVLITICWLAIIITCLVGLHKKRPDLIRVYVVAATIRILLCFIHFTFLLTQGNNDAGFVLGQILNIALETYFVMVYCAYATTLERMQKTEKQTSFMKNNMNSVIITYPTKLDNQNLVLAY